MVSTMLIKTVMIMDVFLFSQIELIKQIIRYYYQLHQLILRCFPYVIIKIILDIQDGSRHISLIIIL